MSRPTRFAQMFRLSLTACLAALVTSAGANAAASASSGPLVPLPPGRLQLVALEGGMQQRALVFIGLDDATAEGDVHLVTVAVISHPPEPTGGKFGRQIILRLSVTCKTRKVLILGSTTYDDGGEPIIDGPWYALRDDVPKHPAWRIFDAVCTPGMEPKGPVFLGDAEAVVAAKTLRRID